MGKQILGSDKILRINNYSLLGLVQSEDWNPTFNATDINELGNVARVDTSIEVEASGSLEMMSAGGLPGFLARTIPKRTNGSFIGYLYSGTASGNKNAYTITEADIVECQFDLVIHERPDQVNFSRSTYVPRAYLKSVSGRIDSAGMGSETSQWESQQSYGFDTPYHDIVAVPLTRTTATTATIINSDEVTVNATNYTPIYFYVDEKEYRTVAGDGNYVTFATTVLTIVGGDTIPADAVCRAVFYKTTTPSATFPALVDARRGTVAYYVKGWQADIFLDVANTDSPASSEKLLKVQSADYGIDFNLQPLRQIALNTAGTSVYCRVPTTPFAVTLNFSMYESDWNEWKRILLRGGTNPKFPTSGNSVYTDSYDFKPANILGDRVNNLDAVVQYYTKNGNLLQQLQFRDLRIDSYTNRTSVGGRAEVSLGFRGTSFKLVGSNPTT
jgi:hypothetical protein